MRIPLPNLSGRSIGRYQIIEPLGEGGMAVVYKAFDTRLECDVAVKFIRTDNLPRNAEESALLRFSKEAKAVAKLSHPNIIKVIDFGEFEGKPYLVMPFIKGGTLKELVKQFKRIPWKKAAEILIPITEALQYAHGNNIIHRDVKPSNILLAENGIPLLTDFGVARVLEEESTQDLTGTSATVGTPEYMAPEQITSKSIDGRADLYALGVVFYEMITGRRPFEADTPLAVLFMQSNDPLPSPAKFVKKLPDGVVRFLNKAIEKNPIHRFQNAEEMRKGFNLLLDGTFSDYYDSYETKLQVNPSTKTSYEKGQKKFLLFSSFLGLVILIGFIWMKFSSSNAIRGKIQETPSIPKAVAIIDVPTSQPSDPEPTFSTMTVIVQPTATITATNVIINAKPNFGKQYLVCKSGPGLYIYPDNGIMDGDNFELIGRNESGSWVLVKDPSSKNQVCWIDVYRLNISGDIQSLQIYAPPKIEETIFYYVKFSGNYSLIGFPTESCAQNWARSIIDYCKKKDPAIWNSLCDGFVTNSYFVGSYVQSIAGFDPDWTIYRGSCTYQP